MVALIFFLREIEKSNRIKINRIFFGMCDVVFLFLFWNASYLLLSHDGDSHFSMPFNLYFVCMTTKHWIKLVILCFFFHLFGNSIQLNLLRSFFFVCVWPISCWIQLWNICLIFFNSISSVVLFLSVKSWRGSF